MMISNLRTTFVCITIGLALSCARSDPPRGAESHPQRAAAHVASRPDLMAPVGRQPDGRIIVPTNQVLDPAGFQLEFPGKPVDLWLSPNGKLLVAKTNDAVLVLDPDTRVIRRTLELKDTSFHGIAASADGKKLYISRSEKGIAVINLDADGNASIAKTLDLAKAKKDKTGPVPGGMALIDGDKKLLVALSRNNTLGIVDLGTEAIEQIEVGIAPYAVLVAGNTAYVTNWAGRRPATGDITGPTSGSQMVVEKSTYAAGSGTVSVVDLAPKKVTGTIEAGLHPSGMILNKAATRLFVANANSDTVSVIDTAAGKVIETISTRPKEGLPFGSAPNALALSPDEKILYAANGSNNSIAVIELGGKARGDGAEASAIKGLIPTGWYPGAILAAPSGKMLYVANVKGVGSLNTRPSRGRHNSHDELGSISIIPIPAAEELASLTDRVRQNNRMQWSLMSLDPERTKPSAKPVPLPLYDGEKSVFKHVIYIIKENRTYDQVFGDLPQGNGEPRLCLFGREVTPNQHAMADEFTLLDNFFCSGILSADGHHWATAAYATDYLEKSFGGWPRSYPYAGDDMMANSAAGFIWDKALAKGLAFRNYGEMVKAKIEPGGMKFLDIYRDFTSGGGKVKIHGMTYIKTIEPYTCPNYIGFPGSVPDVMRADVFLKELKEFEAKGDFPNFVVMLLPNNHTQGTKPGVPTPRACVADNDLALGRIVEAVSKSKFWPETCIFVTEDDPQAGLDHVDGHRTVSLAVSPYTKRHYVDSTNYNQTGMLRTMELILGLTPMNQIDMTATPMINCFTDKADLTPFAARPNNIKLDEMNPEVAALSGKARYWAKKSMEEELDEVDEADEDTLNRIIWHSVKGYDVAYPAEEFVGRAAAKR